MTAEIKEFPKLKEQLEQKHIRKEDMRVREECNKIIESEMLNFLLRNKLQFRSWRNSNYETGTGKPLGKSIILTGGLPYYRIRLTIEEVKNDNH